MGKIIAVCGKICSGKSYYANMLKSSGNYVILSTDEATYDLISNIQGEFYDEFCVRLNRYLLKKAVEIASAGCNVILDWGFWTAENRRSVAEYCQNMGTEIEWHYIDIDNKCWEESIQLRNEKIMQGNGGSDFYVDEGLKQKLLSLWEEPLAEEIDVLIKR
ncbi:MAG: ATP-binding protein [Ruminococcus sp.]|nr:ATP-binding protein [Ruminococcus sp.]